MMLLDKYQKAVVKSPKDANLKVIGAPGSGKTRTLVERYVHLYTHCDLDPERILVVTYSKNAATEMMNRINDRIDISKQAQYNICTINAFCHRAYNSWRMKNNLAAMRIWQFGDKPMNPSYKATELMIKHLGDNDLSIFDHLNRKIKSVPVPSVDLLTESGINMSDARKMFEVFIEYEKWMRDNNLTDYAGQLWNIDRLIHLKPVFKVMLGASFDKIICDEGQDMFIQTYRILTSISQASSIEVYGDPSQSIYGFNGAAPEMLDNLKDSIPDIKSYHLANNYRSHADIVDVVNDFGPRTTPNFEKMICVNDDESGQVIIRGQETIQDQADYIASQINENNYNYHDIYVLARTNSQCSIIHQRLSELKVPSYYSGNFSFWDKAHVKAGLSYMSLASGNDLPDDLVNVLNIPSENHTMKFGNMAGKYTPTRFLTKKTFIGLKLSDLSGMTFKRGQRPGVSNLIKFVDHLRADSDRDRTANIQKAIKKWSQYTGGDYMAVEDDLSILWDKLDSLDYNIDSVKNYINKIKENRRKVKNGSNKVQVMTIHAAKGLESKIVFVTGLSEPTGDKGNGFHPGTNTNPITNEENCLFYTGISRAITRLYLIWYANSGGERYTISSFISDYVWRKVNDKI